MTVGVSRHLAQREDGQEHGRARRRRHHLSFKSYVAEPIRLTVKGSSIGMDGRSFCGNFLFSTGPNTEAGGKRRTPCHIDIPMRNCSVALDGKPMTIDGDVIPKARKAA